MIAAAFLVLLRPYSIQVVLLLLLLLVGTIATILFFCCWHRRLRNGKHPIKSVLSGRSRSREAGLRTHHFRSEGFRHSPRHARRARARVAEEKPLVEIPESEHQSDSSTTVRKRKVKKRVLPDFYHSVQVTPTRKPSSGSGNASLHCSMSSSADFSDEDDYSFKSGSVSPAPGDTLPWNLPRHERHKRKIQGGSVLDPAERAVLRIADERDRVQKKTFTKWINQHLLKVRKHVNDLYEDLRDGHNLISLLEVLSGQSLPREKGRMRFHRLQNVQIALDYLKRRQVKLVNIRNDDITDGNPKLTLGLIWTIILHFQISEIHVCGESEDMTAKERLLMWSQQMTEGYVGVRCNNFTTSWRDGRLFNAIIHKYRPDLVDMGRVSAQTSRSNLEQAFGVAERLGVARLLDPEDMDVQSPDEKSVITYVSTLYDVFPKVPDGVDGVNANDVDIKWVEYQNMVNYLIQWIKHNVGLMSDRAFPNNPVELKALYTQYLQFKENEIPLKETEKSKIKHLYKMLEVWMEFGRIQLPQGFHPNDVEKEWGKLIVAMLEREKSLRPEVDRLEMLQQIATRVQRDCVTGEDKLALARTALQSDAKRLESGVQFQNEAEVSGYLLECENHLRQQVVDIQILLDGKFYCSDRLVQRVSKLRDDLLGLRAECSSVYSQGRTLTTQQTRMVISGITQSLNSGFSSSNHNSSLTPGGLGTPGSTFTSSFTPGLTPALSPAMTPGGMQPGSIQAYMGGGGGGMDPGSLQHHKHMQIRKPLGKSSLVDPNMTKEEVNMNFVQDLINWVEEMQVQLDHGDWGADLPSVETHLENHRSVHRAIEEFQMSLKEAKLSEIQMTQAQKLSYSEKLGNLEYQYGKLLKCSRERQKNLESLHDFVSRATMELIWLNEKEEEEVAFDWSDRNGNISKKREYHADLMRELDDKEKVIKSVQDNAENLLQENHPARLTIEAYRAAMQTQWSWILQLCSCVEQHLKDNSVYFEFFNDAKESMDYLKSLQGDIQRKYGCDRTSSVHKLEDHIQESMDEKEQLLQYRSTVAGLVGKAKAIVQLKPRTPDTPIRSSIPVKAICDYRQIEITIYKDDECVLASNSHRAKWKVISPSGNEAMVPSVCFTVPPPNKEAVDQASRIEQLYQNVLTLWHHSHINMKSVVSWHYLMADVRAIRNWNVSSIKTMLPGEHQQVLSNLQSHFEDFLEDSEESEVFTMADCSQLEREVLTCKEYYEELLKSAEREEHEESVYNLYISEVRNFRMRLEAQEEHLIRQIRTPLDRDDLEQSILRITEQEKKKAELDQLMEDLETMKEKCETFLRQATASPSIPALSSDLNVLIQSMSQVYSMSSIYLEKLKTVSLVVRHSQNAEALVKLFEAKLSEEDAVNSDLKSIDTVISTLKQWRSEIDEQREVFHDLEDGLQKARGISDHMFKAHNERDFDLDWHKEKADQLGERWHNVHTQIDSRLRDLEGISKSLKYYKDSYSSLNDWVREMETAQLKTQENQPEDSKALAELLNQQKVLVAEMEHKQSRIDECQKYSEQYSSGAKDYELQLMTYRAMVDSQHKSPLKRRRMQNSADAIVQEFMDLRTRYTAVVTSMTQYVKFASETLKRTEGEERSVDEEKKEHGDKVSKLLGWMSSVKPGQSKDGKASTEASSKPQVSMEEIVTKKEQIAEALRTTQLMLTKHSDKMTEDEKQEAKEQLKSLHQAYSDLSQQCSDQTPSTEQAFQTIEGVLEVGSVEVYSVFSSVQSGLIDHNTGLCLLEAQLITSGLVLPQLRMCLELDDAFHHNLIDEPTWKQLRELNEANQCILSPLFSSEPLPVIAALREGAISERLAMKVIEIQLATGGLRVSYTSDVLTLERAFQFGLIPAPLYVKLLERQDTWKDLINPSTAEKVSLTQLVQRSVADVETGLRLLPVKKSHNGNMELTSGREISVLSAVHEGLIDRQTTMRLLGAQLFAGGIVNPKTGRKLTVEEALSEGLIDQGTATEILSQQAQNGGIVNPQNGKRLSVDEAVQCDLMSSSSALLVLEKQKGFMGLLWPHSDTLDTSTEFPCTEEEAWDNEDERGFAIHLLRAQLEEGGILDIISGKRYDLDAALHKGLVDEETVLEVLSLQLHKGEVLGDERSTVATLKEAVSRGSISSQIALQIMEQQSLLGGVYDSKSGCTIRVNEALDSGLIDDDLAEKILHSDPVYNAIIDPDRNCMHSISYSQSLGLIDNNEAENIRQHQTDKNVPVLVLDAPDEDVNGEEGKENRNRHAGEDVDAEGNREQNCDSQKSLLPSFTISHGPVCRQILSPILSDQVTGERVIHQPDTSSSLREDGSSQAPTSPLSDMVPGSRNSIHNDMLSNRSNSLSLSDSGDSGAPQAQAKEVRQTEEDGNSSLRRGTNLSCEAIGFTPGDTVQIMGYREIMGNQTVSPVQSDSGVSCSSHSDLLSDERKMENVLNAVQPPASQLVKKSDFMTPDSVLPPASAIYSALRSGLGELVRMRVEGADVDELQKAKTQALEGIINLIQDNPLSHGRGSGDFGSETDAAPGLVKSNSPDLLRDLLKHEALRSGKTSLDGGKPPHEETPPSDMIQIRFQQVLQSVSSSQDPAMLRDVIGALRSILGGAPDEDRPRNLEIIQVEDSSDEAEGAVADPMEGLDLYQSTEVETISDTGNAGAVHPKVRKQYSTQDYLECVGRLQDHADVLVEIRNDLSSKQGSLSNNMEELHSQLEESQANLESTYQELLSTLNQLSGCIHDNSEMTYNLDIMNTYDVDTVKEMIQNNEDMETNVSGTQRHLEDTAFDIQYFISEHAQFLSPAQSRHLLKSLSATQRAIKDQMERVANQRRTLQLQLEISENESQQKCLVEKQKEFSDKLQELCDNLTNTENCLIGQQQQAKSVESVEDLQQVQKEHQALQKDILTNGSALNEVISSTKKFLDENRSKLTPDQIAAIESKLEDAKSKVKLINQRAEESRKDVEKSVTTAIKQETEKEAVVEQLEESKNKIEGLLDWINNIGNEKGMGVDQTDHMGKQNGNMPLPSETSAKNILGEDDDPNGNNGNALQTTDNDTGRQATEKTPELDLDKQYDRVKARHQEILSQQQDMIMATQSAQALLDHQAHALSSTEKDKLQMDIQELKGRYNASLTQAEQQMKQVVQVQEELKKFQGDCEEFEGWLQQAEGEVGELGAPAGALNILTEKLQRQKSFSEDVISHKGDLRFITISGQKVLDVAKACGRMDPEGKDAQLEVDTTGTCAAVKDKLDSVASRYKALHSQCNELGNNLKDVVDKYKKYEDSTAGLLKWLNNSVEEARRQQSEAIAADPQTLQKQLEDTKALQNQTTGRQTAVETLRKTSDSLVTAEGDLLTNQDEIQETVDDIVERYDNLSKSVSDRNEKLQITLTRSLSVQDGLDEMMRWMEGVEKSVKEKGQVPLDSAAIGDVLSKGAALEQDISSRQSSISAMKAKVKKFVETADPSAAALLQSKMDALSQRFSDTCDKHKQKMEQLEQLKDKVEEFEKTSDKVQQFVLKRSQALSETDGPGKNVNELSQLMQDTNTELAEHAKDVEILQKLSKELSNMGPEGSMAQIQGKIDNLSNNFNTFKDTVKEKEEEVSSCQDQLGDFRDAAGALRTWLEETTEKVPVVQPTSSEQSLLNDLQRVNALMEEWTTKGSAVQDINSKGSALCSFISVLTSPAKTKMSHTSEVMVVQQNMSYINKGHESLGELLKERAAELSGLVQQVAEAQKETDAMITWLKDMKKTTASWNSASTEKDAMKTQLEQQKAFEEDMKQKREQLQKLREKLLHLIEKHPDSPEAAKWKQMLAQIDAAWADVSGSVEDRKQHLEESNRNLDVFQTTEPQLRQWLSEKEMMLSVLGPLSMDPNMLNTQRQQVQILLNEFDSRKPQYDQLNEAAAAILSTSGKQDPSSGGKVVKDQLAAVTQKWQGLTGQLRQRAGLIDQAVGKTGQFQDLLRSLSQSAASLETRLNSQQALSSQPDMVKKQLEEANTISGQLREERKRLKEAETLCSELSALVTEDYLKTDLARQLEVVTKPFKQLEDKAVKRIQQLNSAFASSQQFHQTSKDFQGWMNETLQEQSKSQAVSAQVETLQQSLKEHSALQKALSEHEEPYSTIIRGGETLLQNTDGAEKVSLQGQLATLRSNWDDMKKSSSERQDKLQGALQRAQKYHEHAEKLQSWVQESEVREGSVRLCVDPAEVESSISQLKAIQKDVDKHRGLVAQLNTAAESLLEVANADTEAVREEKAAIGQSVDRVTERVQNKRESLDKISQRLKEFNDTHKEAKGQLEGAKKQLVAYSSLGVQAYSDKNLTSMKAQQKSLDGVNTQLEHLKSLAQGLVADVPEADGVTDLLLQANSLEKEYGSLSKDVGKTCSTLEGKLQGIGQFQTNIREMFTRFADLDDELDSMAPVGRELATLNEQQGGIKGFVEKLQELMADTAQGEDRCKKMLKTEASPDLLGLKRDLDVLSKQCGKLMDRAKGREEEVGSTLTRLNELYSKLQQFTNKLGGAEVKEEGQGSVGMETDVINQQLEAFKVFQKEEVDPLQTQLQDINWLGQGLIQNAAKGTSTKGLEHDLEDGNTRWNTLNKKIAERSAQLHEALLHCGRFQDALESLLSWLTDTEELVSNQKPPSAEFKVVKAQIQEQILLQRLLDDRRPTVELIKKEGGKVVDLGAEFVEKEKVGKEIECLGQRWDALLKKAENRHKQLKSILVVAQQFHETLEPLSEWLSATEKHLAKSEPIGTQTTKLEVQISQHKALEEEIMGHSKDLVQAISLGQMLKPVSSVEDKELVQSKLDSTQASYIELQERCRRKAEMLQQALANAQLFGEDEVALMNWLNEVHTRLSEVSVKDYKMDVLEKQCTEQLALHEDIELRKQNVDQAISNGLELLKQTTGDEVVVIQGKLDGIKTRYAEINSMSGNVSKTLDEALTLASKLQHTHEDLSSWLKNVEAELTAFAAQEPVGEQLIQAQDRQKALLKEAMDHKPQVDKLNEVSSSLLELVPWRAREGLDKLVTEDNDRYKAASDIITQHVEQINAAILKSQQFEQAADNLLAWLTEAERKMLSLGEIRLEQDQTTAQLQAQKVFSMDIMRHKDAVDDIVKTGEAIMNSKDEDEKQALKVKIQALLEKYGVVSQLNSERCLQLERAQSLASQFWETYEELWPWLQETRTSFNQLPLLAIEYEALRQQQEELRQMRELIAEHKPHIDKMNKTGPQLLELSPVEGIPIREKYTATDLLYAQLKADVKQRAATLDEAISKSTQFHDKIEPMLESLERIAERLRQPPSISVEVEKIREQITENKAVSVDLEKLQPSYDTLKQRGEEMIARSAGADKDISAKAVQDKLDQMVFTWNEIHALMEEREAKLLDVMDLADKFWCDHCALIVTIKDTQDLLRELEEPGVDPSVVKQQQESLESFKEEIDGLQEELDVVRNLGAELMAACGEPDKPVIKKSIDEVNSAWETLNKTWKERVDRLDEAMQAAMQFQDGLQGMFDWVDIVEHKLDSMSPVGTDLDTVKQQIEELKEFKGEAYQLQIEMERLNHQAGLLLKKVTEEYDRCAIQEPMTELKMLWDNLDENIINRQHKLEGALLALGQFQHALDELLAWMSNTEELLNEQRKAAGDPKAIEIELAKHHVLQNDVLAHKTTVEVVNKAGTDLVESTSGEEASGLQSKLENLTQRWKNILEKTEQRRHQLDGALLQAQGFHGEIEDMQQWLKDTERQLLASKAVGGLPDTAREQLNAHLELCSTLEAKEELYQQLMNKGQQLLTMTPSGQDSNTEQDLRNLQDKRESVQVKVAERKVKLEEALTLATEFHNSLQDFINWLTQAEQTLTMSSPASLILENIMFQIDEHKVFVTEVNSHREQIVELDKTGTHLKYFSQKQDVVLIKNLLISVQGRWEKVVQRSVERGRLLDDARKRAKQFHETWNKLTEWLDESEKALDSELEIANDPDKIKMQLAQHKEFQKALGSKHSLYDTTSRTGRALKDKTSLQDDNQKLDDMLSELRDKWDTVCGKSVERQNKLEEALLFSGQFTDALQALIDWLYRVEPQLAEDQPVHGDIDLVLNLIDSHKVFQKELGKRTGSVVALKRSAKDLIESSHEDSSWVKAQMQELSARWETVCARSVSKQTRLEQALCQAEEFHSTVHILLEWLAEAEQSLRFHGTLPDDEDALRALIEQHKEFMKKQEEKRVGLNKATSMGEAILTICHPDSITTIKHWNTIIKARFEEVQTWARQHQQRLAMALSDLLATQELLEGLLGWLQWAEATLNEKDKEVLPQEIDEVKALIAEHQTFMEEMTRKQPDVDTITKTHKRKSAGGSEPAIQSQIPVLEKGRGGRKRSPTQAMYPSASQPPIETKNPRVNLLVSKWQQVWLLALDRRRKLNDAMDRLEELKEFANFDFDVWRKRYMRWMNHKKSRVMDFFRRIDKDQDGKVTRQEFIEGILSSKFPTSRLEMSAVADIFDRDGDGYIDYYEFVAALHPNKEAYKPLTDADKIEDEVTRQVAKCKCPKRFQVEQIGANKYRFYLGNQFGDSQQLRLVRILRSTVMVRVGGGWMALDEFLVKNDPCRAKGRTNMELREKFILPEGTTQVMASFRYRGRRSRPSSRAASPNRSNSSHSCPAQHNNPALPSTPKTPQHITRNYDKPWLTNSKPSTPLKSSDSFESQGSSSESTPIQGSKLRLPGYLSGKGFQSGEEPGTLINAAVMKARGQAIGFESRRSGSRPGSKAGSRGSSRRGSDASDFDISDIASVCSDTSETVGDTSRATPRSSSRQHGGKPSKIPTPQRRSTPSKLAQTSKR
ncbi:dystonin-like [Salvelinus namaycush]|uniref:Dystonin-like n=1 Tax=Salvelinus namaycush TaxID=8040 RepID=A0A8U0UBK7_SALNM|nr:dystonin-like [Salvelinus namaycush]